MVQCVVVVLVMVIQIATNNPRIFLYSTATGSRCLVILYADTCMFTKCCLYRNSYNSRRSCWW